MWHMGKAESLCCYPGNQEYRDRFKRLKQDKTKVVYHRYSRNVEWHDKLQSNLEEALHESAESNRNSKPYEIVDIGASRSSSSLQRSALLDLTLQK